MAGAPLIFVLVNIIAETVADSVIVTFNASLNT